MFNGDLGDSENGGGSLIVNPTTDDSGFVNSEWWWEGLNSPGGGLIMGANLTDPNTYSLSFKIKYDTFSSSWKKIVSFKGASSDNGLYFYGDKLQLYPQGIYSTTTYGANTFYEFIVTRDDSDNSFIIYTVDNGTMTEVYNVNDASNYAVPVVDGNGNYEFRLFTDDTATSSEYTTGGNIISLKVWDYALTSEDIEGQTPDPVSNVFPLDNSIDMPQIVTINWEYNGNRLPTGFKVYQNETQIDNIAYNGDILYGKQLNQATWGSTVNWKVISYNDNGDCDAPIEWSFTVMDEPADPDAVPTEVVYDEIQNYTGTDPEQLVFQVIDLGGDVIPTLDLNFAASVSHFDLVFEVQDQPDNPLTYPENCCAAFNGDFPNGNETTVVFGYGQNVNPDKLLHWNGSAWNDITVSSEASFDNVTEYEVTFTWTSIDTRSHDEFAVNKNITPTPVTLTNFSSIFVNDFVNIFWTVESESSLSNYNLFRSENGAVPVLIYSVDAENITTTHTYEYHDYEVEVGTYAYWLESVEDDGFITEYEPVSIEITAEDFNDEQPGDDDGNVATRLMGNYPNPFTGVTEIFFNLGTDEIGNAEIEIYNMRGQLVKQCAVSNDQSSVSWSAENKATGVYIYKLLVDGKEVDARKMILSK